MQNHLLRSVNSKGKRKDASNDMKIQSSIKLLVLPFMLSSMNCFLTKVYMSLPRQGCDLKMSVSTFASDFDDKADPIDRSKHSATSKRNGDSCYKHSRYSSIFFQVCRSCFWCASNLNKIRMIERCPSCKSSIIGSLPIIVNEIYGYHHYG
jgi:hypothetical protein